MSQVQTAEDEEVRPEVPSQIIARSADGFARRFIPEIVLGFGGQAVVYRGYDSGDPSRAPVAIKCLAQELIGVVKTEPRILLRYDQEARIAQGIVHPNIPRVYFYGHDENGLPVFVMEYIEGGTTIFNIIAERLATFGIDRESRIRPKVHAASVVKTGDIVDCFRQMLDAVEAVHLGGVIHRDLKPTNFLATMRGGCRRVFLTDFGISRVLSPETDPKLTRTGAILGTPDYMAPEQIADMYEDDDTAWSITIRSDIFALGVIFYEMVTGVRPFEDPDADEDSLAALHGRILSKNPQPFRTFVTNPDAEFERFCRVLLTKEPWKRPASIEAVRELFAKAIDTRARRLRQQETRQTLSGAGLPPRPGSFNVQPALAAHVSAPESVQKPKLVSTPRPAPSPLVDKIPPPPLLPRVDIEEPVGRSSRSRTKTLLGVGALLVLGAVAWLATRSPAKDGGGTGTHPPSGAQHPPVVVLSPSSSATVPAVSVSAPQKRKKGTGPSKGAVGAAAADWKDWERAQIQAKRGNCPMAVNYANFTLVKYPDFPEPHVLIARCKFASSKVSDACVSVTSYRAFDDVPPLPADIQKLADAKCALKP